MPLAHSRSIDASADAVCAVLSNIVRWPEWIARDCPTLEAAGLKHRRESGESEFDRIIDREAAK